MLSGSDKLIRLSHRPAQLFRPSEDAAEATDRMTTDQARARSLYELLSEWENNLPTSPLWFSSPYWSGQSAKQYDTWGVRAEPK